MKLDTFAPTRRTQAGLEWVNRVGLPPARAGNFRSTRINGHRQTGPVGRFGANKRLMHRSKIWTSASLSTNRKLYEMRQIL
jgi:hypothetical protein